MSTRERPVGLSLTYATTYDPKDVRAWSGTVYHIARALEAKGISMEYLGELARNQVMVNRAINRLSKMSRLGEMFPVERTERMADLFARRIRQHLMTSRTDLVFSPGSIPIALLKTKRPKVFYTDATFAGILAGDPAFKKYPKSYLAEGHRLEQAALDNCDLAIYASQWAARTAREYYEVDERKIRVVPFGANLSSVPGAGYVAEQVGKRSDRECQLLFIGVNWVNKGGAKALEAARLLNERGLRTRIHLVGCQPEVDVLPDWATAHGFISKETQEGRDRIGALFASSHFLMLPTLADCLGLVLCEANAFGVPALANDVGGVGEVVKSGVNGELFPADAPAGEWADRIAGLFVDHQAYLAMASRSRAQFEERLNWDSAGTAIHQHLSALMTRSVTA
jgi:glycosyltransferase involved in cell wall biosynthesis